MLRYDALLAFQKVVETGSFRKAAIALNLAQPNLSYTIKKLEEQLNTSLFIRSSRGISLTESGEIFASRVDSLKALWENLTSDLASEISDADWRISIGAHPEVASYALPLFVPQLLKTYPKLRLALKHHLSREINQLIIDSKLDLGIVINPVLQSDLIIKNLGIDEVTLFQAKDNSNPNILIYDPSLAQIQWILRKMPLRSFDRHIECSSLGVIRSLVYSGAGVGILPERVATGLVRLDAPVFRDEICLVYKKDLKEKKISKSLIATIVDNCLKQWHKPPA